VIGIHVRGSLRIGDTLSSDGDLEFSGIPRFSPEHFARVRIGDPLRRKQLDTGLQQLSEEGAAQVFYQESIAGPAPIVGAVGMLQFDVMLHRLEHEYGVRCRLERMSARRPRWVTGPMAEIERLGRATNHTLLYDAKGHPVLLFEDDWTLRWTTQRETALTFHEVSP